MSLFKYIIAGELLAVVIMLNLRFWQAPILGFFLSFVYIFCLSVGFGRLLKIDKAFWQFFHGLTLLLSVIAVAGAITYYFYQINDRVVAIFLVLLPLCLLTGLSNYKKTIEEHIQETRAKAEQTITRTPTNWKKVLLLIIFIGLCLQNFRLLFVASNQGSLRSPFEVLNPDFFVYYFFAALTLLALVKSLTPKISVLAVSLFFFLSFSVALVIYQVGFGFDPFIHQATEKLIAQQGSVTPKPLYYLGQYFLVTFLNKISLLSIDSIDWLLVPVLAAILVPSLLFFSLLKFSRAQMTKIYSAAPLFLMLPFSSFTLTTPQSLANIFLLATLFNSLTKNFYRYPWPALILTAAASLAIHPLSGIPAILLLIILASEPRRQSGGHEFVKKILGAAIVVLASIVIPLTFLLQSYFFKNLGTTFDLADLGKKFLNSLTLFLPNFERNFDWSSDIVYFWGQNVYLIYLIFSFVGVVLAFRHKIWVKTSVYFWTFLILFLNYIFLSNWIDFPFLIEYERATYSERILEISLYFLLPFLFIFYFRTFGSAAHYNDQATPSLKFKKAVGLVFFSFLISNSLYFSYPRHNKYETGHNISTSITDIQAVNLVEKVASGDYVVLANQSVSAAALKELGFKKYYKTDQGEIFFYPIPTGGPLYKFYLSMVYQRPARETVQAAAKLVGASEGYFIINKYWSGYERIVETAKSEADQWWPVDDAAYVFKYKFK